MPEPEFETISEGFQVTVFGDEFFENQETHQETHQEIADKILEFVSLMDDQKQYTTKELMDLLRLSDPVNFRVSYRTPALEQGYITMLHPDNPKHRNQKYCLTEKGKAATGR